MGCDAVSLWLVTAYFPAHIAAGNTSHLKRIPPNNFDSHHKIDGTNSVGDHTANGFVECGFDKVTLHLFSSFAQTAFPKHNGKMQFLLTKISKISKFNHKTPSNQFSGEFG